jgi:hypothetical protein
MLDTASPSRIRRIAYPTWSARLRGRVGTFAMSNRPHVGQYGFDSTFLQRAPVSSGSTASGLARDGPRMQRGDWACLRRSWSYRAEERNVVELWQRLIVTIHRVAGLRVPSCNGHSMDQFMARSDKSRSRVRLIGGLLEVIVGYGSHRAQG